MKLIKSKPRYKCDYCNYSAGMLAVTNHEGICWKNPNRYCDYCKNEGKTYAGYGLGLGEYLPCPYCSLKNKEVGTITEEEFLKS